MKLYNYFSNYYDKITISKAKFIDYKEKLKFIVYDEKSLKEANLKDRDVKILLNRSFQKIKKTNNLSEDLNNSEPMIKNFLSAEYKNIDFGLLNSDLNPNGYFENEENLEEDDDS